MSEIQNFIEKIIQSFRWLLLIFYICIIIFTIVYTIGYSIKTYSFIKGMLDFQYYSLTYDDVMKIASQLIDGVLIVSLMFSIVIFGYDNFIKQINDKTKTSSININFASIIIMISVIYTMKLLLEISSNISMEKAIGYGILNLTITISAFFLVYIKKINK